MTPLKTQDVPVLGMGLGKSIYSPEQIDEFIRFQESQGTRHAFLAESAERAYNSRFGGELGSGLTDLATDHLVDVVGFHLVPLYTVQAAGPHSDDRHPDPLPRGHRQDDA